MKFVLVAAALSILSACIIHPSSSRRAESRSAVPAEFRTPDSSLSLRPRRGPVSSYELIETSTGRVLATARSGIRQEEFGEEIGRGKVAVLFAPDRSAVSITENLTDASPVYRYILIRREAGGGFATRYLLPEAKRWTTDPNYEFQYFHPDVAGLTHDTITLRYSHERQPRTVPLKSIRSTVVPTDSN